MKHLTYYILFVALLRVNTLFGQGCSDAGVCTLGSMDSGEEDSIRHTFSLGQTLEMGERFTLISKTIAEVRIAIFDRGFVQARIPYFFAAGDLGNNAGLGDLIISINVLFMNNKDIEMIFVAGGKVASDNANDLNELGQSFPMPYQSSAGTHDLMVGLTINRGLWHFAVGYQHALNGNENGFLHNVWQGDPKAFDYFESNQLKRGDDLMVRIERKFLKDNKMFTLGLLPIWRFQKDEIIDAQNQSMLLDGSNQLTININAGYTYNINENLRLRFTYGNPVLWRKTRADGLTRFFVFYAGMVYVP